MRLTISVTLSRRCAVVLILFFIFTKEAKGRCDNDSQCEKWGETCCRGKCRPFVKCEGHCIDHYDCVARNEICVRKRCVKETNKKPNVTGIFDPAVVKYCVQDQDCIADASSRASGLNICCIGQCQKDCLFPTVLMPNSSSRTLKRCRGINCRSNCTSVSCKGRTTTVAPEVIVEKANTDYRNSRSSGLPLNPAIIAAIVIAGCIVLTITCICLLREKRLMQKQSNRHRCRRHRERAHNRSQPFWISRLSRHNSQTPSGSRSQRDVEATVSMTEPSSSVPGLDVECICDGARFESPPSYSTLTIAECPPSYEEALRTRHDQGIQVDLFV